MGFLSLFALVTAARAEEALSVAPTSVPSSAAGTTQELPGWIFKPEGAGPFPAIVINHDCSGLGPRSSGAPRRWARILAGEGYVVLMADSFTPRGFADGICTVPFTTPTASVEFLVRADDAYAALAFLRKLPYVDGNQVGVMGGSHGGSTTLLADVAPASPGAPLAAEREHGFAAAIALYPGCGGHYGNWNVAREGRNRGPVVTYFGTYQPAAPLLILIGEKDDWTPAKDCAVLAERAQAAGYKVDIKIYPGAYHSFDGPAPERYIAARRNVNKPDGHGATTGGDAAAWGDAIAEVKRFFARYLKR